MKYNKHYFSCQSTCSVNNKLIQFTFLATLFCWIKQHLLRIKGHPLEKHNTSNTFSFYSIHLPFILLLVAAIFLLIESSLINKDALRVKERNKKNPPNKSYNARIHTGPSNPISFIYFFRRRSIFCRSKHRIIIIIKKANAHRGLCKPAICD